MRAHHTRALKVATYCIAGNCSAREHAPRPLHKPYHGWSTSTAILPYTAFGSLRQNTPRCSARNAAFHSSLAFFRSASFPVRDSTRRSAERDRGPHPGHAHAHQVAVAASDSCAATTALVGCHHRPRLPRSTCTAAMARLASAVPCRGASPTVAATSGVGASRNRCAVPVCGSHGPLARAGPGPSVRCDYALTRHQGQVPVPSHNPRQCLSQSACTYVRLCCRRDASTTTFRCADRRVVSTWRAARDRGSRSGARHELSTSGRPHVMQHKDGLATALWASPQRAHDQASPPSPPYKRLEPGYLACPVKAAHEDGLVHTAARRIKNEVGKPRTRRARVDTPWCTTPHSQT